MGNEKSTPSDLKIEEIIKVTDEWTLKSAHLHNGVTKICVFEQQLHDENIQMLRNLSKNFMLHRHPCILKYISSWQTNKTLCLATEYAVPLVQVLSNLMPMQLCIGLYNILKAVTFLHNQAFSSHNNLCKEAIYVTLDGCWKLGGLEVMTRKNILILSQINKNNCNNEQQEFIDQRGYIKLVLEILDGKTNDEIPYVVEFREFCKLEFTKNTFTEFFQQLFTHPFFSHQFIEIYIFLIELLLKQETEKTDFFKTLFERLSGYPEELIASQLGTLLLSRLVLLNSTAQSHLLKKIFTPKNDQNQSLFSEVVLQKYILPKLLNMFCLRDSQIRIILLQHFSSYYTIFDKAQLQTKILPELLVGIKDTNETLVVATLRTLADLVPVLGASVVVGKGRAKLFADGRPFIKDEKSSSKELINPPLLPPDLLSLTTNSHFELAERPSPDGGEDLIDSNVKREINIHSEELNLLERISDIKPDFNAKKVPDSVFSKKSTINGSHRTEKLNVEEDLNLLDIKCSISRNKTKFDDIEQIFKDMEPVISQTAIIKIPDNITNKNKFQAADTEYENYEGWGDDVVTWEDPEELLNE